MTDLVTLLTTREYTHGPFSHTAVLAQGFKESLRRTPSWDKLNAQQQESLDMICSKIARIMAGCPSFPDHWDDIAGYALLGKGSHSGPSTNP